MYQRFMEMINETDHLGISIFNNAKVDQTGILAAIADFHRRNESLAKYGESKSIRYYGESEKTRTELEPLGRELNWKTALKSVYYKERRCSIKALIIGKGAE